MTDQPFIKSMLPTKPLLRRELEEEIAQQIGGVSPGEVRQYFDIIDELRALRPNARALPPLTSDDLKP